MCIDPITAMGIGLSVMQSVVSFGAAQEDYENRAQQWRQNYTNSVAAAKHEGDQINLRTMQEQEGFAQKAHLASIERAEVQAQAMTSAAASGVSGISLDNIMAGIGRRVAMKEEADRTNHLNVVAQLAEENKATVINAKNRINSMQKPVAPNPLGYILQGVGGALKAVQG